MSRRPRRSGIKFIENDKDRNLTYFKRRAGLYKSATDLSTLTGAKVAVVVESESRKISAYGTPTPDAVIDCFLSNSSPADMYVDEEEAARITRLQDELFQLEQAKAVEDKRAKETKARLKKLQETRVGKLLSKDVKDLSVDELNELLQKLARVEEDIAVRLNADRQLEVSAQQGETSLPAFSSSPSPWLPQINMPPRHLPWAPLHASSSSQHPQSPWEPLPQSTWHLQSPWEPLPQSTWSQSSLLPPAIPPPAAPAPPMLHQAHMMPPAAANETHPYNYYVPQQQPSPFPQVNLDQNYAYTQHFNFNPVAAPDQSHAYTQNSNFNPVAQPPADQQHANSLNFAADGQPPDSYQWPPPSPGNEYYSHHFHALYVQLGLLDDNGVQAAGGDQEGVPDPSDGLHLQADDDWLNINLWDYSPLREDNPGGAARN